MDLNRIGGELRNVLEKCANGNYEMYISTRSTDDEFCYVEIEFKRRTQEDDNGKFTLGF